VQKKLAIFLLLCLCSAWQVGYSAETTYYVDVDVVGGAGDGSSLANAYSSLNAAEAARNADITAGNAVRFLCHNTSGGTDSTAVRFDGWTTDADSYIKVEADSSYRHAGVWDASKYNMAVTDAELLETREDYVRVIGIQLHITVDANNIGIALYVNIANASNEIRLSNLIIKGTGTGTGSMQGINVDDANAIVKAWNCVVYNFISASDAGDTSFRGMSFNSCSSADVWNCTVNDSMRGIYQNAGTVTVVNGLVFESADDFVGTITMTYCGSDDDHTGASATNFVITQTADDYAALVTDADGRDYNVTDGSSELVGTGTDDPGGATQDDTDIAGTTRTSTWDVGAFELVAAAAAGQVIIINMD
jgi:hypothetical protein